MPRRRGSDHRAGRLSRFRPRLPPRRHGLSRPVSRSTRHAVLRAFRRRGGATDRATAGPADDARTRRPTPTSPSGPTTFCSSVANRPACRTAVHAAADARLRIPMRPGLRSLNVAVAAAMALGEMRRQIGWPAGRRPRTAADMSMLETRKATARALVRGAAGQDHRRRSRRSRRRRRPVRRVPRTPGRFERKALDAHGPYAARRAAAARWRCCAAASSRRPACIPRRSSAPSRPNSRRRFPARRKTRASSPPASR